MASKNIIHCICPYCERNFPVHLHNKKLKKQRSIISCHYCHKKSTFAGEGPFYLSSFEVGMYYSLVRCDNENNIGDIQEIPITVQAKDVSYNLDMINHLKSKHTNSQLTEHDKNIIESVCPYCDHHFSIQLHENELKKQKEIISCTNCHKKSTFAGKGPFYLSTFVGGGVFYLVRCENESYPESIHKIISTEQDKNSSNDIQVIDSLKNKKVQPKSFVNKKEKNNTTKIETENTLKNSDSQKSTQPIFIPISIICPICKRKSSFPIHISDLNDWLKARTCPNCKKKSTYSGCGTDYVATPDEEKTDSNDNANLFSILYRNLSVVVVGFFIFYALAHHEQGLFVFVNFYLELDVLYSNGFWGFVGRIIFVYIVGFIVFVAVGVVFNKDTVFFRVNDGILILGVIVYSLNFFSTSHNDNMHDIALVKAQVLQSLQRKDCNNAEKNNEIYISKTGKKPNLYLHYIGECFHKSGNSSAGDRYFRQYKMIGDPNGSLYFTGNEE